MVRIASDNICKAVGLVWRRNPQRIVDVVSALDADVVAEGFHHATCTLPAGQIEGAIAGLNHHSNRQILLLDRFILSRDINATLFNVHPSLKARHDSDHLPAGPMCGTQRERTTC